MADLPSHLQQAQHNEAFASRLAAEPRPMFWDWLITASFYAAVHYVEALLFVVPDIGHTEKACSGHEDKHHFRARMVKEFLSDECYRNYRKLQASSYNVRYLALAQDRPTQVAVDYYSPDEAVRLHSRCLSVIRDAVLTQLKK